MTHTTITPCKFSVPHTLVEAGMEILPPSFTNPLTPGAPCASYRLAGAGIVKINTRISWPFPSGIPSALTCFLQPKWRHHLKVPCSLRKEHLCLSHPGKSQNSDFPPAITLPIYLGTPSALHMLDGHRMKNLHLGFSSPFTCQITQSGSSGKEDT